MKKITILHATLNKKNKFAGLVEGKDIEECKMIAKNLGLKLDKKTIPIYKKKMMIRNYRNWREENPGEKESTSYTIGKTFKKR
jgi:hypothetical protein